LIASGIDELILKLNQSLRVTVVVVTHDLTTLLTVCDRIAVLVEKTITVDTPGNLMRCDQPWIREFFHGPRAEGAKRGVTGAKKGNHGDG
jgi:phospholipid/cholesterol/gamma-HCH transport system ATP-binding protein